VVRQGRAVGIPTPVNALLNDTLLTLVSNHEAWEGWRHNHERVWGLVG
jgi:ketopantoate reductase